MAVDGSRESLRRSVDTILKVLRGTKRLDLFQPARRDPNYEIEHYAEVLNEMVQEGKFDYIGISEVRAETIRRAHKVTTVAAAEIELSLQAYEWETKDVISTCQELGIAVVAYSTVWTWKRVIPGATSTVSRIIISSITCDSWTPYRPSQIVRASPSPSCALHGLDRLLTTSSLFPDLQRKAYIGKPASRRGGAVYGRPD